ncbi:competence protein ComEC [Azotobacter vinelandii]|nr:competence protein ComEC [Azotobacter vinelandii]
MLRTGMLALTAGLLVLRFLPALPPWWLWSPMALGAAILLAARRYSPALFLFGLGWACLSAHWALEERLPVELDGRTLWLEGLVVGLPARIDGTLHFQLEEASSRRAELPGRLRLAWHAGPEVRAGERWRLAVSLKRPRGLVNPQGFDYEAWLLAQRIGATGTVKAGERLGTPENADGWRDSLRQRLLQVDAHGREGALAALVMGDASGLSVADWKLLQDTGTVHLMVISGQHVGLLAGLVYGLVVLLARFGLWPGFLPWLPCACGLAFATALGYGWLAGFGVPVQRACAMLAVVLFWRLRFRHLGLWLPILLALDGVLLLEPLASLQPGFWLSFGAVVILVLAFGGRLGAWSWRQTLWRAQWTSALGLLPLLLALGLPISLSGPLANLVAVPWVGFAVVPLALLGTLLLPLPAMGEGLLWLAGALLETLFRLLGEIAGAVPAWLPHAVPVWGWLLALLGTLLILLPAGVPLRVPGLALLLPLAFPPQERIPQARADVWLLDVGQGLAVLVRTRGHDLLYDAGPRFGDFDLGERVVLPSLRNLGVGRLDRLLLSHADGDHAGGALAVRRALPVGEVVAGEAQAQSAALAAQPCARRAWQWDGVRFATWHWTAVQEGNRASCVLLVEAAGERLLLTGDIDAAAERALLDSHPEWRADWLLAPHHGSRSSSSPALLKALAPRAVLISRGWNNGFGHPHAQVVERYRKLPAVIHDTARQGALRFRLGDWGRARGLREEPRFWREK